jgi:hypothetical protein
MEAELVFTNEKTSPRPERAWSAMETERLQRIEERIAAQKRARLARDAAKRERAA